MQIDELINACRNAADIYEEKPGLVGPHAVVDLYRAIATLAEIIKAGK